MTLTMYDAADPWAIPADAKIVAGYGDGGDYNTLVARFPHAQHFMIATNAAIAGDCLDCERGDADPSQAPGWWAARVREGRYRPCFYGSVDTYMPAIVLYLERAGIARSKYRLWVAHWGQPPVVPAGYDAIQYQPGSNTGYDTSALLDDFFAPPAPPSPPTLTTLQREELGSMLLHLPAIIGRHGALTRNELGELQIMYSHLGGIPQVK
jgi:hypothetical protein